MAANGVALPAEQLSLLPGYSEALKMIERAAHVDEAKAIADKASAFRAYAIKARNRDMEYLATEIRMRAERRAGQILIEDKNMSRLASKQQGRPKKVSRLTTLIDLGLTRDEAARWQRIARLSQHDFDLRLAKIRANGKPSSMDPMFSSASDEWLTPKEVLDSVISVLGAIDLDPCAERGDDRANVPAGAHLTKKDDGLQSNWADLIFMNPPYSQAADFIDKLIAEWRANRVSQAIALLPSRTDTAWFQKIHAVAPVCFVRGRIVFKRPSGDVDASGAPFPSAVFYLGPRLDRFTAEFEGRFGQISQVRN